MNFEKIKLWAFLFFASAITGMQAQSLFVLEKTGAKTDFALTSLRSITFSGANLILNKKDGSTPSTYAIAGLRFLSFSQYTEVLTPSGEENSLSVYPNPVSDILNIQYAPNAFTENISIEVMSIDGKIMYSKPYNQINTVHSINTFTWSRGIYLLRFNNGTEVISKKIIKY